MTLEVCSMQSQTRLRYLDLLWVIVLAVLLLLFVQWGVKSTWLRAAVSLPLALFGVGYAASAVLYPLRTLEGSVRLMLSLGLSLVILVLGGLALHLLPIGVQAASWAWLLYSVSVSLALTALFRRWLAGGVLDGGRPGGRRRLELPPDLQDWTLRPGLAVLLMGALVVASFSLGLAGRPAPTDAYQGYSLLWIVEDPHAENPVVEVGVRSMEFTPETYRVLLLADGQVVEEWPSITLAPKHEWRVVFELSDYWQGAGALEAQLFREQRPDVPYRQVRLWPGTVAFSQAEGETLSDAGQAAAEETDTGEGE
jgi:uncharacterized membrane protein